MTLRVDGIFTKKSKTNPDNLPAFLNSYAWCPYNRSKKLRDQNDYMETVRSAIVVSISAIVVIAIIAMLRSLSARFPYNRSDRWILFELYSAGT